MNYKKHHKVDSVPERKDILHALKQAGKPLTFQSLIEILQPSEEATKPLNFRLKAMVRDGQILFNRSKKYGLAKYMDLIKGRIASNPSGHGKLITPDKRYFIAPTQMRKVLHGDIVLAYVAEKSEGSKKEGEATIAEIITKGTTHLVGTIYFEGGIGFLKVASPLFTQDMIIPDAKRSLKGKLVEAHITHYPTTHSPPIGKISSILAKQYDASNATEVAIRSFNIPNTWNKACLTAIKSLKEEISTTELKRRVDLRKTAFITIDGADSKDFDDAVFAKKTPQGWQLMVAIADVAHFVKPASALDKEAYHRGTSVYFPDKVIPMLPERLSNDLCSLNPAVDRLCMVCSMQLDHSGELIDCAFQEGVMHSHARLTYQQVTDMLDIPNQKNWHADPKVVSNISALNTLYEALKKKRQSRGTLEINTPQTVVNLKENGAIKNIKQYQLARSNKIIEECMLLANTCAARYIQQHDLPLLYRIHDTPDPEKVAALGDTLQNLKLSLSGGKKPSTHDFSHLLKQVRNTPNEALVTTAILRTFKQAVYSPENIGHYGLNFDLYTHFTSPIRRYPDLIIHRLIKQIIHHNHTVRYSHHNLVSMGESCSLNERRADDASREVLNALKCLYAQNHIGKKFAATVSGIVPFGLFASIDDLSIEGLVHVSSLKSDYYHYDPVTHSLNGETSKMHYTIGTRLKVEIKEVDLDKRRIDLCTAQ